jgi:hypothetical protein
VGRNGTGSLAAGVLSCLVLSRAPRGANRWWLCLVSVLVVAVLSGCGGGSHRRHENAHGRASWTIHDGLAANEWVVDVLAQGDLIAPSILWLVEEIVAALANLGCSEAEPADGYRAIWQFTVGELIIRRGLARTAALGRNPFVVRVLTSVDPRELSTLAALAPYWAPARGRDSYDVGLDALLHGLTP